MRILIAGVFIVVSSAIMAAQTSHVPMQNDHSALARQTESLTPIAGSPKLDADWAKARPIVEAYARNHPGSLKKTTAWNFTVGQKYAWWATNFAGSSLFEYQVPSTCRAVGTYCYVFVEDSLWNAGRANQAAVDAIKNAFDSRVPADSSRGIYQLDTQYFGDPPDVDNDLRVVILILDIVDGLGGTGAYTAGYFHSLNELPEAAAQLYGPNRHSNFAEIYYVDGNPGNLATTSGITNAAKTAAHEFQHMIHWKYDLAEMTFVNEGLAEVAEALCGYSLRSPSLYYTNPNVSFFSWAPKAPENLKDYARAALFTLYLVEQFGNSLTKRIVQSPATGVAGYNDALASSGSSFRFDDVLKNFAVANALNDRSVDTRYGFSMPLSATVTPTKAHSDPNVAQQTQPVEPQGTVYLAYKAGKNLKATFASQSPTLVVRAVATGSGGKKVTEVILGSEYSEPDFGTKYSQVIFAVTNPSTSTTSFSYSSTGSAGFVIQELAFEDGYPDGFLQFAVGDTAVVWFEPVPGAVLDSVKIAFRRDGSIGFGIWKFTGAQRPSPLGKNYGSMNLNVTGSPTFSAPYPVPYPNWHKVDVSSWNVDLNSGFAVGFAFGSNPSAPGLMISTEPYAQPHHSYTYASGSSGKNWYTFVSNSAGDSAYKYVVRAFAHFGSVTGIAEVIELQPTEFRLENNYPNPFNPSTTIQYSVMTQGRIRLRIFDLVGREVATLVDDVVAPGYYTVTWKGADGAGNPLPSGVYYYRLESSTGQLTRRMVLLK